MIKAEVKYPGYYAKPGTGPSPTAATKNTLPEIFYCDWRKRDLSNFLREKDQRTTIKKTNFDQVHIYVHKKLEGLVGDFRHPTFRLVEKGDKYLWQYFIHQRIAWNR